MAPRKHLGFVWDYDNGYKFGALPLLFVRFEGGMLSLATIEDIRAAGIQVDDVTWLRQAQAEAAGWNPAG